MLEVTGLLFLWLLGKMPGLLFRLTWGAVKVIAVLLLAAGLFCAGDVMLIMPSGLLLVLALLKKAV